LAPYRQILALCITATNTFSALLVELGTSIPAFQTFFNYVFLNIIYTSYTVYRYGFKGYFRFLSRDGWKYIILSFLDVQGNYFTVLAYRYTSILSAQLINFWAIVVVVIISFLFLHVRYHIFQIAGIFVCVGGMGILLGSDHITGATDFGPISRGSQVKGDLFALAGATFYGFSNVAEEYLVSERPLYEVVGQLGFWGMLINGTQAGIFDRNSFRTATWNGKVGGYLTGYTLCLSLFYSLAPILFRLASAAFFNISLLTGNFWGVVIGVKVFHYHIHWMYPIAFTCIMLGHVVYYFGKKVLGEARKPWLGGNQEKGVSGVGTARRKVETGHFV
jgi:solute carrier family 35 protein F1/2